MFVFFLVETQIFWLIWAEQTFPTYIPTPSDPVYSAETWDLLSSLGGVLHHTGRFRCFTGLPAVRNGHCCCCSRSIFLTGCIITCCRVRSILKPLLAVVLVCITPKGRNGGSTCSSLVLSMELVQTSLFFCRKKCFLVESCLCFYTFDPERYNA